MSFDFVSLIITFGLIGVWLVIFAESGLFIGFFFPGDSLLFTAGLLAARGTFNVFGDNPVVELVVLILGCFIAAVAGVSVGYAFGRRVGPALFKREDSLLFHKDNLVRANAFYEKHGGKTIILARFLPIVRTFAPIVAGVGKMDYKPFLFYNIIGGAIWAIGIPTAGFFLGSIIPDIDKYLLPIIVLIILISLAPTVLHLTKDPDQRAQIRRMVSRVVARRS